MSMLGWVHNKPLEMTIYLHLAVTVHEQDLGKQFILSKYNSLNDIG